MKKIFKILLTLSIAFLTTSFAAAAGLDDFVITIQSDNVGTSSDTEFLIPASTSTNYNVDCNDDGVDEATAVSGTYTCDYSALGGAGTYTIRIEDNSGTGTGFTRFAFNDGGDKEKALSIDQWGTSIWSSMSGMFNGASNLVNNATDAPNLSNVTLLNAMFRDTDNFDADLSSWDVSNVTNTSSMFLRGLAFNGDLSTWDTRNVSNMSGMFNTASSFDRDIGNWNTSNVTLMNSMFGNTDFNQDISTKIGVGNGGGDAWDVSGVTAMNAMFLNNPTFNQDIGNWDTGMVQNMQIMFANSNGDDTAFNQDISSWNTGMVSDMISMFGGATGFDQNIGSWDVTNLTNASGMFAGVTLSTSNYDGLLSGWNAQVLQAGVVFDGGNSIYCLAEEDRDNMVDPAGDNWTITDGGVCPDTDGDLVPDYIEAIDGTDSNDATEYKDTDGDLVPDYIEINIDTTSENDSNDFLDTDTGGTPDYVEITLFINEGLMATDENVPTDDDQDTDNDNISDYDELKNGTDPLVANVTSRRSGSRVKTKAQLEEIFGTSPDLMLEVVTTPTESNPFGGEQCPAHLIITQNMKKGDVDGRFGSYAGSVVTEVNLLQAHINRILGDEYALAAGPVDGIYGTQTRQGVQRLQTRLNQLLPNMTQLDVDGIVGPYTKAVINNSCNNEEIEKSITSNSQQIADLIKQIEELQAQL